MSGHSVRQFQFSNLVVGPVPGSYTADTTVAQDLPYFQGHFPDQPMLPGAVILEISLAFVRFAMDDPRLTVRTARQGKFSAPILPGATYRILAERHPSGGCWVEWREGQADDVIVEVLFAFGPLE